MFFKIPSAVKKPWQTRRLLLPVILLAFLSAYGMETPEAGPMCQAVTHFTADQQEQMAKDLALVPETSPVWLVIGDWISMRDQRRAACR